MKIAIFINNQNILEYLKNILGVLDYDHLILQNKEEAQKYSTKGNNCVLITDDTWLLNNITPKAGIFLCHAGLRAKANNNWTIIKHPQKNLGNIINTTLKATLSNK